MSATILTPSFSRRKGPVVKAIAEIAGRVEALESTGPQGSPAAPSKSLLSAIDHLCNRLSVVEARLNDAPKPRVIEVKLPGKPAVKIEGIVHPAFDEVLELAAAREHIFLPGPAGCGKSHLARSHRGQTAT